MVNMNRVITYIIITGLIFAGPAADSYAACWKYALRNLSHFEREIAPTNPGHGDKILEQMLSARKELIGAIPIGANLTVSMLNMCITAEIDNRGIPGFIEEADGLGPAWIITTGLPGPEVEKYMAGQFEPLGNDQFWGSILSTSRKSLHENTLVGFHGCDNRTNTFNVLFRMQQYYRKEGARMVSAGRSWDPVQIDDVAEARAIVSRLGNADQQYYMKNFGSVYLPQGEIDPRTDEGKRLDDNIIIYLKPHETMIQLVDTLVARYKTQLAQMGVPVALMNKFIFFEFLGPLLRSFQNCVQTEVMFNRLREGVASGSMSAHLSPWLALHIDSVHHNRSLLAFATHKLDDERLSFISQDDPRFAPGTLEEGKGFRYFADVDRFREIMDNIEIVNGDLAINVAYFEWLFGDFLKEEHRAVLSDALLNSLSYPIPSSLMRSSETPFTTLWATQRQSSIYQILSELSDEDLAGLNEYVTEPNRTITESLDELRRRLNTDSYGSIPDIVRLRTELEVIFIKTHAHELTGNANELIARGSKVPAQDDYLEAHRLLNKLAYEVTPGTKDPDTWHRLGLAARDVAAHVPGKEACMMPHAIGSLRYVCSLSPNHPNAWFSLGYVLHDAGDFKTAAQAFRRATDIYGQNYDYWYELGLVEEKQNNFHEATEAFKQACKVGPQRYGAWFSLGTTLLAQEDFSGAREAFETAHRLDPESPKIYNNLILALALEGNGYRAIKEGEKFCKTMDIAERNEFWVKLAGFFYEFEDYAYALIVFNKVPEIIRLDDELSFMYAASMRQIQERPPERDKQILFNI